VFIVHGTRTDEKKRGVVADNCRACGELTIHHLSEFYRRTHLYFIPLGRGELVGAVLTCTECGGKFDAAAGSYAELLCEEEARSMDVRDLVLRTNPRLAEAIAFRTGLKQDAARVTETPADRPDPRVKLAFAQLADVDRRDPRAIEYHALLAQWGVLDPAVQTRLLRDIDRLIAEREQQLAKARFVALMSQRFKPEVDGALTVLAGIAVLAMSITIAATFLAGMALAIGIIVSIVLALVGGTFMHQKHQRWAHKRFFRNVFLPEAQKRCIDIGAAAAFLSGVDLRDARIDARARSLAGAVPLLQEVSAEADHNLEPQWEVSRSE
jgi:hypothetical protein